MLGWVILVVAVACAVVALVVVVTETTTNFLPYIVFINNRSYRKEVIMLSLIEKLARIQSGFIYWEQLSNGDAGSNCYCGGHSCIVVR